VSDDFDPKLIAAKVARQRAAGMTPRTRKRVEERLESVAKKPTELRPLTEDEAIETLIPDVLGTVKGWRAWGIKPELPADGIPLLHSVTYGRYIWKPREVQTAKCRRHAAAHATEDPPGVPGNHCSCGNYSAKDYDHLVSMQYHFYDAENQGMFHVIGEVANWGKVVEGTQGWRAQHSYPVSLYVPFEAWPLALPLQTAYGVPVRLKNFLGRHATKGDEVDLSD
jgi:hypothetical protein